MLIRMTAVIRVFLVLILAVVFTAEVTASSSSSRRADNGVAVQEQEKLHDRSILLDDDYDNYNDETDDDDDDQAWWDLDDDDSSPSNSTLLDDIAKEYFYWFAHYVAQLDRVLSTDQGPFTIFLPSQEALFALKGSFPQDCLYYQFGYNEFALTDRITSIVLYHIVQGVALLPSELVDGQLLATMNGESATIGVNDGTGSISIEGVGVMESSAMMPVPTVGGNMLYHLDMALLPPSIADQKSDIITACDTVPYITQNCLAVRDRFDEFAGTQQCAACGGYFQDSEQYCSRTGSTRDTCVPECQWFTDYCTKDCCWDTHEQQPELTTPLNEYGAGPSLYEYGIDGSNHLPKIWTVVPCKPGVTIKAGWHATKRSGTFDRSRTQDCDIIFVEPNSSGTTPSVWYVDCNALYYENFSYFNQCGPYDRTVAIWMEDAAGNFVDYYLDPLVGENIWAFNDSCALVDIFRITLAVVIPLIVLILIGCCYFCYWRRKKERDYITSSLAANREESNEPDANNTAVNPAAEAMPPSS